MQRGSLVKQSRYALGIEAPMGMGGDMLSAALLGLGASEAGVIDAMTAASRPLGGTTIEVLHRTLPDGSPTRQINIGHQERKPLPIAEAPGLLEQALRAAGVRGAYAGFAHRALAILCQAERTVHGIVLSGGSEAPQPALTVIGRAHTPYREQAPYQPVQDPAAPAEAFFVELDPRFADGLRGIDSFSHLFVLSYLDRSFGYSLLVRPPWKDEASQYGLFATRSPNRPSPVGLTRVRLRLVEGTRLYTDPLDLFDGTPVLDVKPYVQSLDGAPVDSRSHDEAANDGWLTGSEHLELHRRGVLHSHPGGGQLHEAQDIVVNAVGAAWALQYLGVDLSKVVCVKPIRTGGGTTEPTSHGQLSVPAPATQAILNEYEIPCAPGPVDAELLTPTGAALLTALSPSFVATRRELPGERRFGTGLGKRLFREDLPNVLRLCIG